MTTTFYEHWRQVPEGIWRWKNFSPAEIVCRGTGKRPKIRVHFGRAEGEPPPGAEEALSIASVV